VVAAGTIPFTVLVGEIRNGNPLQTVVLIALISGVGLMDTRTVNTDPEQLPDTGVTL
jgi:hypothetical protein